MTKEDLLRRIAEKRQKAGQVGEHVSPAFYDSIKRNCERLDRAYKAVEALDDDLFDSDPKLLSHDERKMLRSLFNRMMKGVS